MLANLSLLRMRTAQIGLLSSACMILALSVGCGGDTEAGVESEAAMANWSTSYEETLAKSKAEEKPMLMLFTGSDW